jgi:predicted permease
MIVVVTALFFLLWSVGMHFGPRYFREFHSAVPSGLRDSGFFGAMVAYFGLGFIAVSVYLVATRHLSIALLFAVLGIWLIASMFGFGSDERNKREA